MIGNVKKVIWNMIIISLCFETQLFEESLRSYPITSCPPPLAQQGNVDPDIIVPSFARGRNGKADLQWNTVNHLLLSKDKRARIKDMLTPPNRFVDTLQCKLTIQPPVLCTPDTLLQFIVRVKMPDRMLLNVHGLMADMPLPKVFLDRSLAAS